MLISKIVSFSLKGFDESSKIIPFKITQINEDNELIKSSSIKISIQDLIALRNQLAHGNFTICYSESYYNNEFDADTCDFYLKVIINGEEKQITLNDFQELISLYNKAEHIANNNKYTFYISEDIDFNDKISAIEALNKYRQITITGENRRNVKDNLDEIVDEIQERYNTEYDYINDFFWKLPNNNR